ncbi:MAG: sigma-70 family RNA polymerase sigma factor [bacterium]|nr:sigma-70 family RNA polymerase sigma factor [bacterium]
MTDPSTPQDGPAAKPVAETPESAAIDALIARARTGHAPALAELCRLFYPEVRAQVHNSLAHDYRGQRPWLSSLLSTGDVVHDIFLSVVRGIDRFRGGSKLEFVGYLAALTRNRLIDMVRFHEASRRDARRVEPVQDGFEPTNGPAPEAIAESAEEIARAHELIKALPPRDRALLRGRLEDDTPFEQLARTLGYASADSARKSYHLVQAKLLTRLQQGDQ